MIFPRDLDTFEIIKEIEEYFSLSHKTLIEMSDLKLHEYINELTLLFIGSSKSGL